MKSLAIRLYGEALIKEAASYYETDETKVFWEEDRTTTKTDVCTNHLMYISRAMAARSNR